MEFSKIPLIHSAENQVIMDMALINMSSQHIGVFSLVVLILAPMYFVETIFALILFQWGVMAITELCYQTSIKIRSVLDMKRSMGQFIGAFAPLWVSERPGGLSQAGYQSRNRPHRAGLFSVVCVRGYEQKCDCPEIDCVRDSKPDSLQAANGDELP